MTCLSNWPPFEDAKPASYLTSCLCVYFNSGALNFYRILWFFFFFSITTCLTLRGERSRTLLLFSKFDLATSHILVFFFLALSKGRDSHTHIQQKKKKRRRGGRYSVTFPPIYTAVSFFTPYIPLVFYIYIWLRFVSLLPFFFSVHCCHLPFLFSSVSRFLFCFSLSLSLFFFFFLEKRGVRECGRCFI